jgi:DNA-binding response OmpR family regulator
MPEKILIVEDEISLQETLAYNLKRQGYEVLIAGDGLTGLDLARKEHPDIILLDVMLPGMDGFEVCRELRKEMDTPILILTARDDEIDRVVGLELGADDYITKPFSMRELMARIKVRLRVSHLLQDKAAAAPAEETEELKFGNLVIDLKRHEVQLENAPLALKPKEFDLLFYLAHNQGRVISRETLLEQVWGWDYVGDSRTVDVHIRWLREKIEKDPQTPERIITVRGAGYRFEG